MADLQPTEHETELPSVKTSNNNTTTGRRAVCALYMRVSTKGHGQNTDTQAVALREYAERRGFDVVEYRDEGVSGIKDRRPALDRLMKDARARKLDAVAVTRYDRFGRSLQHLVTALNEFNGLGVDFISVGDSIDTSTPAGKMIFGVLGAFAEFERNIIRERVTMGLSRARKEGKTLGRPKVIVDRERVKELHKAGKSIRTIAAELNLNRQTVHNIVTAN
jgi:DNA invertase Pin-like site-specific DNA recombinase